MSGTSLDGVDAAFVRTDGESLVELGPWITTAYPSRLRDGIRELLGKTERDAAVDDIEHWLTQWHTHAINNLLKENNLKYSKIDIIGFHGHTITHRPEQQFTWQLGDARMLASNAKVDVVADFRLADIGAGGEGAPLAPLFHRALAANQDKPVAVLNVGGVANVTWIGDDTILAFDTGPGNALIDDWVACHDAGRLDWGGEIARGGAAKASVVEEMLSSPYFAAPPPKSLDRQDFDLALVEAQSLEDGAATLTAVTVGAVMAARQHFPTPVNKWLVTGGGRNNAYFMESLAAGVGVPVLPVESAGWQGDALEAHAFGYLAVRSVRGLPLSLPTTTGVPAPTTGGQLFCPY